jgi:hypothetical protein
MIFFLCGLQEKYLIIREKSIFFVFPSPSRGNQQQLFQFYRFRENGVP